MFYFQSAVMSITDVDVVQRLVPPAVFGKLGLTNVTVDGQNIRCTNADGSIQHVNPVLTFEKGIEAKEYAFSTGKMTIARDGLELLVEVFHGPTPSRAQRKVLRCAIRDRQLDGTEQASPLTSYPNTHPATNRLPHPDFKCAELSIYCFDPDNYLPEGEMLDFIMHLDDYIYNKNFEPQTFFRLWTKAFASSNMAPGQAAPPLRGVAQQFVESAGALLKEHGYHRMDAVAGWYNVVIFFLNKMRFTFTYGEHQAAFAALQASLKELEQRLGRRLDLREQAWVVALQNIPAEFIPTGVALGYRWINTPTDTNYVCRVHKDLNPFPPDKRLTDVLLPAILKVQPADAKPQPQRGAPIPPSAPGTDTPPGGS